MPFCCKKYFRSKNEKKKDGSRIFLIRNLKKWMVFWQLNFNLQQLLIFAFYEPTGRVFFLQTNFFPQRSKTVHDKFNTIQNMWKCSTIFSQEIINMYNNNNIFLFYQDIDIVYLLLFLLFSKRYKCGLGKLNIYVSIYSYIPDFFSYCFLVQSLSISAYLPLWTK